MRGLATRASWASTCLAGASRLESLLLYAESPPATYFGDAICARRRLWLRCGECGAGSRCMQDLMKRGERRTDLPRDAIRMRSFFPPAEIAKNLVLSPSVISARVVSARSRPLGHAATRPHRSPFGTIRLWYDIAVFVAVLSFHSARYRSDYVPRRPLEARVISARSRPRPHGLTPITVLWYTIRLWYDIAVFVAVLSFHSARYRSGYGPRRPLEARVISARSRDLDLGSTASLTPITVLAFWYDTTLV